MDDKEFARFQKVLSSSIPTEISWKILSLLSDSVHPQFVAPNDVLISSVADKFLGIYLIAEGSLLVDRSMPHSLAQSKNSSNHSKSKLTEMMKGMFLGIKELTEKSTHWFSKVKASINGAFLYFIPSDKSQLLLLNALPSFNHLPIMDSEELAILISNQLRDSSQQYSLDNRHTFVHSARERDVFQSCFDSGKTTLFALPNLHEVGVFQYLTAKQRSELILLEKKRREIKKRAMYRQSIVIPHKSDPEKTNDSPQNHFDDKKPEPKRRVIAKHKHQLRRDIVRQKKSDESSIPPESTNHEETSLDTDAVQKKIPFWSVLKAVRMFKLSLDKANQDTQTNVSMKVEEPEQISEDDSTISSIVKSESQETLDSSEPVYDKETSSEFLQNLEQRVTTFIDSLKGSEDAFANFASSSPPDCLHEKTFRLTPMKRFEIKSVKEMPKPGGTAMVRLRPKSCVISSVKEEKKVNHFILPPNALTVLRRYHRRTSAVSTRNYD